MLSVAGKTCLSIHSANFLEREPTHFQNSALDLIRPEIKNTKSLNSLGPVGNSLGKKFISTEDCTPVIQNRKSATSNKKMNQLVPGQFESNLPQQGYGNYQYPQDQSYGNYQYPQDQGYGNYQYPQDQGYGQYYYSPDTTQDQIKRYEEAYQYNTHSQENQNHTQDYNTTYNKYYNVNISVHQNFSPH